MREDRALLRPTEGDRAASRVHLERPEDAELHPPPVHWARRPRGQERSDLLRDVAFLRSDRQDADGIGEPLEMQLAAIQVAERPRPCGRGEPGFDCRGSRQDLPRRIAWPRDSRPHRGIRSRPGTASPASSPIPAGSGRSGAAFVCLKKARLQLDRRPDRLTRGTEHREGFVSPQLDHGSVPSLDMLSNDLGEPCRQPGGRLIAALLGEHGVSTNVRDEEGSDLPGRFVRSRNVFGVAHPRRSMGSADRSAACGRVSTLGFPAARLRRRSVACSRAPASGWTLENGWKRLLQPFSSRIRQPRNRGPHESGS